MKIISPFDKIYHYAPTLLPIIFTLKKKKKRVISYSLIRNDCDNFRITKTEFHQLNFILRELLTALNLWRHMNNVYNLWKHSEYLDSSSQNTQKTSLYVYARENSGIVLTFIKWITTMYKTNKQANKQTNKRTNNIVC